MTFCHGYNQSVADFNVCCEASNRRALQWSFTKTVVVHTAINAYLVCQNIEWGNGVSKHRRVLFKMVPIFLSYAVMGPAATKQDKLKRSVNIHVKM
jgi:hypothetical protein